MRNGDGGHWTDDEDVDARNSSGADAAIEEDEEVWTHLRVGLGGWPCLPLVSSFFLLFCQFLFLAWSKVGYTICIQLSQVPMALVLGFLGFFNAVLMAPILGGLLIANIESTPSDPNVYMITVGKGLIDNVLSDFLWARAIILTSPVVATLGLGIQIPLAVVVDSLRGTVPSFMTGLGGLAIIGGFVVINLPSQRSRER